MTDQPWPPRWVLTVSVLSPCAIGIDEGQSLEVDLATVTDEYGLPFIPRHRLAARLRDAALTVLSETGDAADDVAVATQLFGASFISGRQRRAVTIDHAQLPRPMQAAVVAAVTAHREAYRGSNLLSRNIRAALTTTVHSTARDDRGAPVRGSFRQVQAVVPGVVFEADLRWAAPPTAQQKRFLARCVLAMDQIGHGETDGHGRVDCAIAGDRPATAALAFEEMP